MVGHGGSSAGSYLADPTSPVPSHCASIVATSTVRVKCLLDRAKHCLFPQYTSGIWTPNPRKWAMFGSSQWWHLVTQIGMWIRPIKVGHNPFEIKLVKIHAYFLKIGGLHWPLNQWSAPLCVSGIKHPVIEKVNTSFYWLLNPGCRSHIDVRV